MSESLSICMFSNLYPPINTGSSTFTHLLAKQLVRKGHQVTVVTCQFDDEANDEVVDGIRIVRLPSIRLPRLAITMNFKYLAYTFTPANQKQLHALFTEANFDVIHQQNHIFDTILSSPRLAARFNLPLVMTIHTHAEHPNKLYNAILYWLDAVSRWVIFRHSDAIVSPGPVTRDYVQNRHRIAESPVIPYGTELPPLNSADVEELRARFELGDGPVILSLGHVTEFRDRTDVVGAMPTILAKYPNATLLIVGEVNIQKPVELAKALGVSERVIFAGFIAREKVSALFALSTIEAHTVNTAFPAIGIASMEAMAAGLPVVTIAGSKGHEDADFVNWENIVLVPGQSPADMAAAILRLLDNDDLRDGVATAGQRLIRERYSWDAVADAYVSLYQTLINERKAKE